MSKTFKIRKGLDIKLLGEAEKSIKEIPTKLCAIKPPDFHGVFPKILVKEGDMVKAARTGRVVFADYLSGYGYTVILDHSDGLYSVYAKNSKLLVKLGESVLRSKDIARVGRSGSLAYLHFQIRKKSIEDNPLYYLP